MNVLVIGLGSMGKRRIRLIRQYDGQFRISGVDGRADRIEECVEQYGITGYSELSEAIRKEEPDCAFIAAPPLAHDGLIRQCLTAGMNVFTELNLVPDGWKENIVLAEEKKKVLFLSSTFLYREEIQYMRGRIREYGGPLGYCYHVGQYLPDWHPWESYKSFFAAHPKTNGCREILAIELPWILSAFGPVKEFSVQRGRLSGLEIDYPDYYMIQMSHESGTRGQIMVDIVSRKAVRNLEIMGEGLYIRWNGTPDGLFAWEKEGEKQISLYERAEHNGAYSDNIVENAYYHEVCCFFGTCAGTERPLYEAAEDLSTLKLIDQIEGK